MSKEKYKYWAEKIEGNYSEEERYELYKWYRLVQEDFQKGKLTKKELAALFELGSECELE